jgi:hypothetical protein
MDPQIIAVPKVGPRLFTRVKTFLYLVDSQVPGKLTCLGRLSRECNDLVFSDVW